MTLTPQVFYILFALAIRERHGYDIMKQVAVDSNGKIKMGPGTLYGAIKRLLEEKLITEAKSDSARRKYYKLTEKGRGIFSAEMQRYREAVKLAGEKSLQLCYV